MDRAGRRGDGAPGALDPARLPELPEAGPRVRETFDDPLDLPEGVQIGAEHTGGRETDVWVANVSAEVAGLLRACLGSVARGLGTCPG